MDLIPSSDSQSSPSPVSMASISASFPPKNLWWILGGLVLTSTCGYLGYRLYKRKFDYVRHLILELRDKKSLIDLLNEIRISYSSFYLPEVKNHRNMRRRYPRKSDEYTKAVAEFQIQVRKAIQNSIDGVLNKYNLTESNIDACLEHHSKDYEIMKAFDSLLEALYMGRRRCDFALAKTKRRRLETCRNLEPEMNAEEVALVHSYIEDDIFEKYGREREQVEAVANGHDDEMFIIDDILDKYEQVEAVLDVQNDQIDKPANKVASRLSMRLSQDLDDLDSK